VAKDRVISTVDPEARHGHKTRSRSFDGYKGHISIDPDSEVIVACDVTAGNVGDGEAAKPLVDEALAHARQDKSEEPFEVYGDASYGTAELVESLENAGVEANVKVQEPSNRTGLFSKSDFEIDLDRQTVRCPRGIVVRLTSRKGKDRAGVAQFGKHCCDCPLKPQCTTSKVGRLIRIHAKEATLQRSRLRQRDVNWKKKYRATRPKVERKIAHLMQRRHGGRRARMRGTSRVKDDFSLLCATANLKRLAKLGLHRHDGSWAALVGLALAAAFCFVSTKTRWLSTEITAISRPAFAGR
jgi:hypothetical protein